MIRRRVDVQRCPAVPTAPKNEAARAPAMSALSEIIRALFPPSSRIVRPRRAPTTCPIRFPIFVEPVALMSGSLASPIILSPIVDPRPITTQDTPSETPFARSAAATIFWVAIAHRGVLLDGFHTTGSPQTNASAEFQDQ